jgi:hypothetical protein
MEPKTMSLHDIQGGTITVRTTHKSMATSIGYMERIIETLLKEGVDELYTSVQAISVLQCGSGSSFHPALEDEVGNTDTTKGPVLCGHVTLPGYTGMVKVYAVLALSTGENV